MAEHLYYPGDIKDMTLNCPNPNCKKPVKLIKNYKIINTHCPKCHYPMTETRAQTMS